MKSILHLTYVVILQIYLVSCQSFKRTINGNEDFQTYEKQYMEDNQLTPHGYLINGDLLDKDERKGVDELYSTLHADPYTDGSKYSNAMNSENNNWLLQDLVNMANKAKKDMTKQHETVGHRRNNLESIGFEEEKEKIHNKKSKGFKINDIKLSKKRNRNNKQVSSSHLGGRVLENAKYKSRSNRYPDLYAYNDKDETNGRTRQSNIDGGRLDKIQKELDELQGFRGVSQY